MRRRTAIALERMKVIPLRLRLSHLRALIRHEPVGSSRAQELAALLQQLTAAAASEIRAV
jgi:hypothetical protein